MTTEEMHRAIEEIPGDRGWWKRDTGETFHKVAGELALHGVPPTVIVDSLERLYGATADEFGE